jgi:hypothetical protein
MTNREVILRLGRDMHDESLIDVVENNLGMPKAAVERYFSGRETRKKALLTLLVHISWHAKEFVGGDGTANRWIGTLAGRERRQLQSKVRGGTAEEEVRRFGGRVGKRKQQNEEQIRDGALNGRHHIRAGRNCARFGTPIPGTVLDLRNCGNARQS